MSSRRQMHVRRIIVLCGMLPGCMAVAQGQVGGYAMSSYGFHGNPLYNYEMISDQVREGYLELSYAQPSRQNRFRMGYVGGLMVFNQLAERNYYEHRLELGYTVRFPSGPQGQSPLKESTGDEEETEKPFRGNALDVGLRIGTRYDREVYREYDNIGLAIPVSFTWGAGSGTEFRLVNQAGTRRYYFVPELDNITDVLEAWLTTNMAGSMQLRFFATAGLKHYTTDQIDTTRIETGTSTSAQGNRGKGKGGSGSSGQNGGKKKQILANSATTTTYQVTLGVAGTWTWKGGSGNAEALYRFNPYSQVRFVSQYANSSLLTEDIYNDFFNYGGPELRLGLRQGLPYGLQIDVRGECQRKTFLAPALDLSGIETSASRVDLYAAMEGTLSKTIPLNESIGLEIAFRCGTARNKSNDAYNDYSLSFCSLGLGIGF